MTDKSEKILTILQADITQSAYIPLADQEVAAGFPSPAQDYREESIDIIKELIQHPANTYFCRVAGDSMIQAGVNHGDLLIIDKSLPVQNGNMIICLVDGEFVLKHYQRENDNTIWLLPANPDYKPIKLTDENEVQIWGIVTYSIKSHMIKKRK